MLKFSLIVSLVFFSVILNIDFCYADTIELPGIKISLEQSDEKEIASALKIFFTLTLLSLAPGFLVVMTSFTRIIIVLSMLRQAFGMPATPPNVVLISLAIFLTLFSMMPTIDSINDNAFIPYQNGQVDFEDAVQTGAGHLKTFMLSQTREEDLVSMIEMSNSSLPQSESDISFISLMPAFMLSELKTAFQIGFIIFLPFLLIDIVIASILMSMGMLMVPPLMISLPIKVLMFVLIDGWLLVVESLLGSFL
jgi:flagellar biosynthesis protein FliP